MTVFAFSFDSNKGLINPFLGTRESWWDIEIGGKSGVKRKGTRLLEKKNETKILYFGSVILHALNIGYLSHFYFPKALFPSFLHHFCLCIPPTFSLENVFLYLLTFWVAVVVSYPDPIVRKHIVWGVGL